MVKKIWLGTVLVLIILTSSFYILMPDKVRIDFTKTRTIFSIYNPETEKFDDIQGIEYVRIFDGTRLMRAKNRTINYILLDGITLANRQSSFKERIVIDEIYKFVNEVTNVENVPVSHNICFNNAENKIFEYMIDRIEYDGETKDITSPFEFRKNMKLTFQEGYYRAKVYNYKYATDKIKIRYRVTEDYQCFDVRLFDPVIIKINLTDSIKELKECEVIQYNYSKKDYQFCLKNNTHNFISNITGKSETKIIFYNSTCYTKTIIVFENETICKKIGYQYGDKIWNCAKYNYVCYWNDSHIISKAPYQSDQKNPNCPIDGSERCDVIDPITENKITRGYSTTSAIKKLEVKIE